MQAEWREASLEVATRLEAYAQQKGTTASRFALAWCLANPIVSSVIIGPRTGDQFDDNFASLEVTITADDEAFVNSLVPPGEHSGKGFQDSAYPITGRGR